MCEKNKKPQETIELTDDQLEDVAGGADGDTKMRGCDKCGLVLHERRSGVWYCTVCGSEYRVGLMMMANNTRPGTELM